MEERFENSNSAQEDQKSDNIDPKGSENPPFGHQGHHYIFKSKILTFLFFSHIN